MLFKEKWVLSNCDSIRQLAPIEIEKRFLTCLTFSEGVVLSPNTLIDNIAIAEILCKKNVVKYLNEEGAGHLVLRGINIEEKSLFEYYTSLPADHILSSIQGSPTKGSLDRVTSKIIEDRIKATDKSLQNISPSRENVQLSPNSLKDEIYKRISTDEALKAFFDNSDEHRIFLSKTNEMVSRSHWYKFSQEYFSHIDSSNVFKAEIIDPAYNYLFAKNKESFLQDNVKIINDIPPVILDAAITIKSLRNEINLIVYPIQAYKFISSFSGSQIFSFLTDKAIDYIEDKMPETFTDRFSRKNWFGMYPLLRNFIGLEVKK